MSDDTNILGTPGPEVAQAQQNAAPAQKANPKVTVQMPESGPGSMGWWWAQIDRDERVREKLAPLWKQNLNRYKGNAPNLPGIAANDTTTVNIDFANTEAKKSQLFGQLPTLNIAAKRQADIAIAPSVQAVMNSFLEYEIDAFQTVHEVLTDVICPSGIGFVEIGYQAFEGTPIQEPVMVPGPVDPMTGQASPVQAIGPDGHPQFETIPNILRERFYRDRFSPMKGIVPSFFDGSDYDDAPYLGRRFNMPTSQARQMFGPDVTFTPTATDKYRLSSDPDVNALTDTVSGVVIWYQSSYVRPDVADPLRYTQLVMLEGRGENRGGSQVLVHRDSPYQDLDERGAMVGGMRGNPISPLTIRYTSDSCWPNSDCSVSRSVVDEICEARSVNNIQRRRGIPMFGINTTLDTDSKGTAEAIAAGQNHGIIKFGGDPAAILKVIQPAVFPQENFRLQDILRQDCAEMWSLNLNASDDTETATKTASQDRKSDARLAKERICVQNWHIKCATKEWALLQKFADASQFAEVIDEERAQALAAWNEQNRNAPFRFTARPDSSMRVDNAQDREVWLRQYNIVANDPNVDRRKLVQSGFEKFNQDPTWFMTPEPPQPQPEKPKISLTMKLEDFAGPAAPTGYEILKDSGIEIPDSVKTLTGMLGVKSEQEQTAQDLVKHPKSMQQVEHPGHVKQVETIDQHAADRTGERAGAKPMNAESVQ